MTYNDIFLPRHTYPFGNRSNGSMTVFQGDSEADSQSPNSLVVSNLRGKIVIYVYSLWENAGSRSSCARNALRCLLSGQERHLRHPYY